MTEQQSLQVWIGLGFVAFLVLFLVVAFFTKEKLSQDQRRILKFLMALCAGFGGALIAGEALLDFEYAIGKGGKLAISGTAGFALFFTVWLGFDRVIKQAEDAFHLSISENWTFEITADAIASHDKSIAEFIGFRKDELGATLKTRQLHAKSPSEALSNLGALSSSRKIRKYEVVKEGAKYILKISQ